MKRAYHLASAGVHLYRHGMTKSTSPVTTSKRAEISPGVDILRRSFGRFYCFPVWTFLHIHMLSFA